MGQGLGAQIGNWPWDVQVMGGNSRAEWNEQAAACRQHYMEQQDMMTQGYEGYSRRMTQGELDEMAMDGNLEYRVRRYRQQREELEAKHSREVRKMHERHAEQISDLVVRLDDANRRCAALLDARLDTP